MVRRARGGPPEAPEAARGGGGHGGGPPRNPQGPRGGGGERPRGGPLRNGRHGDVRNCAARTDSEAARDCAARSLKK